MNVALPDVSVNEDAPHLSPLEWVGMQGIDFPIMLAEADGEREVHARADLTVDLPIPYIKGIHMSRLYRLLDGKFGADQVLSPQCICSLLQEMIASHEDCGSKNARLKIEFDLLVRRPALLTEGLAGWKAYPVSIEATHINDTSSIRLGTTIVYSSTCPCSAALSRQLIENGFKEAFKGRENVDLNTISSWLRHNATLATPHSQRSEAKVYVDIDIENAESLGLIELIAQIETALATPVQTAVKRADEQAFAALNGGNLMFVEDAARRIQTALTEYNNPAVFVRHMESLHPHDAVAWSRAE